MPNWCFNSLQVTGSKEDLEKLREDVKGGGCPISFEKILPTPTTEEELDEQTKDSEHRRIMEMATGVKTVDWYSWRVTNWGTKWDITSCDEDFSDEWWTLSFDTAWSPPVMALRHMLAGRPLDATLEYHESGNWFAGYVKWEQGVVVEAKSGEPGDFEFSQFLLIYEDEE